MNAIDELTNLGHAEIVDTITPVSTVVPGTLNEEERQRILSEMGRLRAAARRQFKTSCRECGADIIGLSRRKFCNQTCQRRHWRERLKQMKPGDLLPAVE